LYLVYYKPADKSKLFCSSCLFFVKKLPPAAAEARKNRPAYAAAALKFVNGKGAKAVIFDEDGIRRMYSEAENIFASVYPDGTISTFFHPRAGKKYWESQVKKYAKK